MNKDNPIKKILILGLPNTGKSQIFTNLTKQYSVVSNQPFTTLEIQTAVCRIGTEQYEVLDTPGLHSLYIHSEEEILVRDIIFASRPDLIIQCIDANRIKQSLGLTVDLLELDIPMVVTLNAVDEITKKGINVDSKKFSALLGVPVVETVATDSAGMQNLKNAIPKASTRPLPIYYGDHSEKNIKEISGFLPDNYAFKRKISILFLLKDSTLEALFKDEPLVNYSQIKEKAAQFENNTNESVTWLINKKRRQWITQVADSVIFQRQTIFSEGFSHSFAQAARHPIWGIPIMLGILFFLFVSVVDGANALAAFMHQLIWIPVENWINNLALLPFWKDFLIGDYGILTFGFSNALLTVIPILGVFFLVFNTLEDIGYVPNLTVLLRRISEKFGLSGNAVMPITLGFGCKTMATLTTRSLKSRKERYIAIFLIAFALPCAAQMALNMSILGRMGMLAFLIVFFVLVFVEMIAGLVLNKIIKEDRRISFIQELPDIRMPNYKAVLKKTYYKLYWFLKEAAPIFIYSAVILFFADYLGILDAIKYLLKPVITGFLGFPLQMVDVLILCLARQEAAAALIINLVNHGDLNYIQTIVAVTITTMFVPCLANVVAIFKELGAKAGLIMVLTINIISVLIAGALNWILIWIIG